MVPSIKRRVPRSKGPAPGPLSLASASCRANDYPYLHVWNLRLSPRTHIVLMTFHTHMYGFSPERARFGLFGRLSIHLCMDSCPKAPPGPLGRYYPYLHVWNLRPRPCRAEERHVAVPARASPGARARPCMPARESGTIPTDGSLVLKEVARQRRWTGTGAYGAATPWLLLMFTPSSAWACVC